jgi:hypothetical protein
MEDPGRLKVAFPVTSVIRHGSWRDRMGVGPTDGELFRKHADELTRFAIGLVGPVEAPDVVAEAVLGAIGSPGWNKVMNKRTYLLAYGGLRTWPAAGLPLMPGCCGTRQLGSAGADQATIASTVELGAMMTARDWRDGQAHVRCSLSPMRQRGPSG